MQEECEGLRAEFEGVPAAREQDVVVDFEIALAVVEVLAGGAASYEVSGDLKGGSGRERRLRSALPCVADAGFVQQIGAGGEGVGEAQIVLADEAVVAGFGKDEAADSLVAKIVDVGCEGERGEIFGRHLPVAAGGGDPEALRRRDCLQERDLVAVCVECDCVYDVELVDVTLFESESEAALLAHDGAGQFESVTPLACGSGGDGEGVGRIEDAVAVGEEEGSVEGVGAGLGDYLDGAAGEGWPAVFRREHVGVDANGGDGAFGRQSAAVLEAVDHDGGGGGIAASGGSEDLKLARKSSGSSGIC